MQRLPDTLTKSTQNISKSFEVPIQHQQYFVPNLPPQCDTNTTICLKTLDIDAKRYIAINIATLCLGAGRKHPMLMHFPSFPRYNPEKNLKFNFTSQYYQQYWAG